MPELEWFLNDDLDWWQRENTCFFFYSNCYFNLLSILSSKPFFITNFLDYASNIKSSSDIWIGNPVNAAGRFFGLGNVDLKMSGFLNYY